MTEEIKFCPHDVEWDPEKISRIWDFYSRQDESYFSAAVGHSILKMTRKHVSLRGKTLDFGCGVGHFISVLIEHGISAEGFDMSPESLKRVELKFRGNPFFKGTIHSDALPLPVGADTFDTVFFIETIEHLLPPQVESTLAEIRRVLRKGGHIVMTTPNEEDLKKREVMCPDCGGIFHRKEHVSSHSRSSLSGRLSQAGFREIFCRPVLFSATRLSWIRRMYIKFFKMAKEKMPSLLYIGQK